MCDSRRARRYPRSVVRAAILVACLLAVPLAWGAEAGAPRPAIVSKPIPFGAKRRAETAEYAARHYGARHATWRLSPHVIVEHYTATESFSSVFNYFSTDAADPELHQLPGVCAHYVIDRDGTIYQLVSTATICRHTVGLNYVAIGIEHVGTSDGEILGNPRQLSASLRLTVWLMQKYAIRLGDVIGHNESLTSRWHLERYGPWRCQTHGDWVKADMDVYRAKLAALARRDRVPLGAPVARVRSGC
jgi:N-acetylmuramoyl-L-alanine amidase